MKKLIIPFILLFTMIIAGCGNDSSDSKASTSDNEKKATTITYESETGPVEVPANPERVVVLSGNEGNVIELGVNIVGASSWSKDNPNFQEGLKDAAEVSAESLEKIIELKPDLILASSDTKSVDKLKEIAPTVIWTYNKVDYLTQHIEIGKALNKEKEATAWVEDFKKRTEEAGEEIKAKIGEDATVSVVESYEKELYVFGDSWGRGTEILYQQMKLNMPEKVKEMALNDGYYALSAEVLPQYAGDYVIFSKDSEADNSFQETETYKEIPAVKNNHVFEVDAKRFIFNDPITLGYQLDFFKSKFLGN